MRSKRYLLTALVLIFAFLLTGCEKVKELTADEEQKIVMYAAKVVAKQNLRMGQGLVRYQVSEDESEEATPGDAEPEEEEQTEEQEQAGSPQENTPEEQEQAVEEEPAGSATIADALGLKGVSLTYKGSSASDDYNSNNYYVMAPPENEKYLVMTFELANTSKKSTDVDIASKGAQFAADISGNTVNAENTILLEDLNTYVGTLGIGEKQTLVLLFAFPADQLKDISGVALSCTVNGTKNNILL